MRRLRVLRRLLVKYRASGKIDAAEFLSAFGTFLATLAAFASVSAVVLRLNLHSVWSWLILIGWLAGVTMQITAGAIARIRRAHAH